MRLISNINFMKHYRNRRCFRFPIKRTQLFITFKSHANALNAYVYFAHN